MRPAVSSTLACPLPAALMLVLACWLALTIPLRIETSSPYHLHADGSARPLTHEHHLHAGLELPLVVQTAEAPPPLRRFQVGNHVPIVLFLLIALRLLWARQPANTLGEHRPPEYIGPPPSRPPTALLLPRSPRRGLPSPLAVG
ncbi:MAG: hypothetical protein KatS3mg061_3443 [Dehalococcoidia bacterium]|nr:MAG: hypothetical protein KatS3mg061_3443 [Dehalococcoidia bacterium]